METILTTVWQRRGSSVIFDQKSLGPFISNGAVISLRQALSWAKGLLSRWKVVALTPKRGIPHIPDIFSTRSFFSLTICLVLVNISPPSIFLLSNKTVFAFFGFLMRSK